MTAPVISAWSAVSPFGIGREVFRAGLLEGRNTAAAVDHRQWQVPDQQACLVPGFDLRQVLGKKGTRSMDRLTGLAVSAVGQLLHDVGGPEAAGTGEDIGLVLGTMGSVQSMMSFTRTSMLGEKPFFVDPSLMPNAVMNCAAGQSAIWHQLKGPNATIAGCRPAGLSALSYTRRLLFSGRAQRVLCGGVDEYSNARAWLEHHSRAEEGIAFPLGEGCAVLLVEPSSHAALGRPLAEILAVQTRVALGGDAVSALAACVRDALRRAQVRPEEMWAACTSEVDTGPEHEVLADLNPELTWIPCAGLLGDTGAASATFQIASVLSTAERDPAAANQIAVITSVDRSGPVGCAVLRLLDISG
ncbi:beta-ketoacyl synthase N-terminal-like domain-containing protein [Streptosporangium sp. NPDC000396]|uniref:beta-ketoacyl synthase N-terminal-like domain-containing protein n=1 Tax=Streptosporangium sp. NPDC000396 TaxID=3366185 RepID=UPI0036CC4B11